MEKLFKKELKQIEEGVYEVDGLKEGSYDNQAKLYDKLISNTLYNKIMWGNTPKDYADFCRKSLDESSDGEIVDIGCGTLGFTHSVYAEKDVTGLFLCDLSIEMLMIGKEKLEMKNKNISGITFLRSDALDMPFKDQSVQNVFSFGVLHIFDNPIAFITEISRILKPDGKLFLTSLCTDRKISRKYLNFLNKKGHVAKPLQSGEILSMIRQNGLAVNESWVKGGMIYIKGEKG